MRFTSKSFGAYKVHTLLYVHVDFKLDTIKNIESLPGEEGDQYELVTFTTFLSESEDEEREKRQREKEVEALGEVHENSN